LESERDVRPFRAVDPDTAALVNRINKIIVAARELSGKLLYVS
jgi:hypothetical protein